MIYARRKYGSGRAKRLISETEDYNRDANTEDETAKVSVRKTS
jgi:hypothetical protein